MRERPLCLQQLARDCIGGYVDRQTAMVVLVFVVVFVVIAVVPSAMDTCG